MKTTLKRLLTILAFLSIGTAFAGTFDWGNNYGGNADDKSRYAWRSSEADFPPTAGDTVRFFPSYYKRPITVTFGQEGLGGNYSLDNGEAADAYWTKPVTLSGAGVSRHLVGAQLNIKGVGRELVIDNLWVEASHTPGESFHANYGRLYIRNNSLVDMTVTNSGNNYYSPENDTWTIIDNAKFYAHNLYAPNTTNFTVIVRNNGEFSYAKTALTYAQMGGVRVIDGNVTLPASSGCIQFLPERTGTLYINGNLEPPNNDKWTNLRLGGTANISAYYPKYTGTTTLYGRGNLVCRASVDPSGYDTAYDLSEITLAETYFGDSLMTFLGDTTIYPAASKVDAQQTLPTVYLKGLLSINVNPKGDDTLERKTLISDLKYHTPDAGLAYTGKGLGSVTHKIYVNPKLPERIGSVSLDEGVKLVVQGDGYYWHLRTHDLTLGKNAVLDITQYDKYNQLHTTGVVTIDPTAKIKARMHSEANKARPIVVALDDVIPEGAIEVTNLQDGWEVGHNGGSWFYWKGSQSAGCAWGNCWVGTQTNNNWSSKANWGGMPGSSAYALFSGFTGMNLTNDVDNLQIGNFHFWGYYGCGPFIIRGKPIKLNSTRVGTDHTTGSYDYAGVHSSASYPQIFECEINSDKEVLGVTAAMMTFDHDASVICFRSNVNVRAGSFAPCGDIVIDGTVNAKDLRFISLAGESYNSIQKAAWNRTELCVRNGGKVFVTDQTTANTATGHFWIAQGGLVSITNDWVCNTVSNENNIAGTLEIVGKLGGDASQTYYGKGTLKVQGTDGKDGASLRIGHGITLAPTAATFGDMPIEVLEGGATINPTVDTTLSQDITVSGLGAQLVAAGANDLTLDTTIEGADFDIVKRGTGTLTLAQENASQKGRIYLEGGTLAITADQYFDDFKASADTTLAYDGTSTLFVSNSVNLAGVTLKPLSTVEPSAGYVEVLRVPKYFSITGYESSPTAKLQVVTNTVGEVSLTCKTKRGLMMMVK